jgi:hypothetical protein
MSREKIINHLVNARTVLSTHEFYSKLKSRKYEQVLSAVIDALQYTEQQQKTRTTQNWVDVQNCLMELHNQLVLLKNHKEQGRATHSKMLWLWTSPNPMPGIVTSVQAQMLILLDLVIPLIREDKAAIKELKQAGKTEFAKSIDDNALNPYQKIFSAIKLKFPKVNSWLNWKLVNNTVSVGVDNRSAIINKKLMSMRGIKNEEEAAKWCAALNSIPGFYDSVTVEPKGRGWYVVINTPEDLIQKLAGINREIRPQSNWIPSTATILAALDAHQASLLDALPSGNSISSGSGCTEQGFQSRTYFNELSQNVFAPTLASVHTCLMWSHVPYIETAPDLAELADIPLTLYSV